MADDLIVLDRLTRRFGSLVAVDGISLAVPRGEVLGFLGPNGAGKSTTMKMVAGFLAPTSGTAVVCGADVVEDPVEVKRRIGYLPEGAPTYGDMTPAGFLDFIAAVRGFDGAERRRRVDAAVEKVSLADVLHQPIETLSKGYKRRVGLAQAILHDPPVLILDEPTDGLDPNQKHHVRGLIRDMAAEKAIVVSTHILEEVEAVCTRAVVIARGRLLADGTPEDLLARSVLHNAVLIHLDAAAVKAVEEALEGLAGVSGIEVLERTNGVARIRVHPMNGASIAVEVGERLRARQIAVREFHVEKGSLDEVFRRITLGGATDGGAPPERMAAQ